jgi:hypothetical protein
VEIVVDSNVAGLQMPMRVFDRLSDPARNVTVSGNALAPT